MRRGLFDFLRNPRRESTIKSVGYAVQKSDARVRSPPKVRPTGSVQYDRFTSTPAGRNAQTADVRRRKSEGAISTQESAHPVSPDTDAKRQRAALSKQLDMRLPERLCTVVDENEMNVVGCQAIGGRPPAGACGVGSPGDSGNLRRRPRRRTASRQISIGHFRPRNSPSAAAIREQK
jgi:hypothetical protein